MMLTNCLFVLATVFVSAPGWPCGVEGYVQPSPRYQPITGWSSYYSPGVMDATVAARKGWGHIPQDTSHYDGYAAMADCSRVGDEIWLRKQGDRLWLRIMVADCARRDGADGALDWMRNNRIHAEVNYEIYEFWGGSGGGIPIEMIDPLHSPIVEPEIDWPPPTITAPQRHPIHVME